MTLIYNLLIVTLVLINGTTAKRWNATERTGEFRLFVFEENKQLIFNFTENTKYTILDPTKPVKWNDLNYYWEGHYIPYLYRHTQCEYIIRADDEKLNDIELPDGTKPRSIQFGCKIGNFVCENMKCVPKQFSSNMMVLPVVVVVIFLFGVVIMVKSSTDQAAHGVKQAKEARISREYSCTV